MIKGLLFDINGTITDILTNECDDQVYRVTANFLSYYGVMIEPWKLKDAYFELNKKQRHESKEEFPEFNVGQIFYEIIQDHKTIEIKDIAQLADSAAIVFRASTRFQLKPYECVNDVLASLKDQYIMGILSDGQTLWALPELRAAGLEKYFTSFTVSGDYGFRKPDPRFYDIALKKMGLSPEEVLYIGNDMYRDIYGAHEAGMKTVFFKSNQGDHEKHGAEPDYIIYHFSELPRAIKFLSE